MPLNFPQSTAPATSGGGLLPIAQSELIGPAGISPTTTIILAALVFLAIGAIAANFPKVGRPLEAIVIGVLVLEAWRTGF